MLKVVNPATEQVFRELEEDTRGTLRAKADAARAAQPAWAARPIAERVECARRFGELLAAERDTLAATLTSEMGKPITQGRAEVDKCALVCRYYADEGPAHLADARDVPQPRRPVPAASVD